METNQQQGQSQKRIKFFNILSLDNVINKAIKTPKKPKEIHIKSKIDLKIEKLKTNYINNIDMTIKPIEKSKDLIVGQYNHNDSIAGFLQESHPDLNKFINTNEWLKIVASTNKLIVTTRNKFRITITTISQYSKSVTITDHKKNTLFKGVQTVNFKTTN